MAETGKRIEVRYGTFACRVEGFDDPVERLREVLSLVQKVVTETPALGDQASELDDAQLARIHDALGHRRGDGDPGIPGVVVIQTGERSAADIADAETLQVDPEADAGAEPAIDARPAEAGPHASAAIYAAPAAAVAEAAFRGFSEAGPADPDDDAGDPGPEQPDETAEERVQAAGAGHATARSADSASTTAPGGPGEGWAPWSSGPAAASSMMQVFHLSGFDADDAFSRRETGEAGVASAGQEAPGPASDGAAAGPLPAINIFAPPPDDDAEPQGPEVAEAEVSAPPAPAAPAAPGREPVPAAADAEADTDIAPAAPGDRTAVTRAGDESALADDVSDAGIPDDGIPEDGVREDGVREDGASDDLADADEVLDDGAGDWRDSGDRPDAEPLGSAENRLAALITRYQSGMHDGADRQPAPDARVPATISVAELAERSQATEVDDLLTVSAAWLTLVRGRERFTRREVMRVFETLPGKHPRTLEARIKGFGKLVRSGTLQLVDEGEFALAPRERSHFRELIGQG